MWFWQSKNDKKESKEDSLEKAKQLLEQDILEQRQRNESLKQEYEKNIAEMSRSFKETSENLSKKFQKEISGKISIDNMVWMDGFKTGFLKALDARPILDKEIMDQVREQAVDEAIRRLKNGAR